MKPKKKSKSYRINLRKFIKSAEEKKERQWQTILKIIKKSASQFVETFQSVEKLAIVGSFAKKEFYSKHSDVDILVTGLNNKDYFKALSFWETKLQTPIDLIRSEDVPPKAEPLMKRRLVIYEKD